MDRTCVCVCVYFLAVCIQSVVDAANLREWKMEDNCGSSIGRYDSKAGLLRFTASDMYHYRTREQCEVTIEAEHFSGKKTKLAFYFTSIRLSKPCLDTNLTIADGYPGFGVKSIDGLPSRAFCGHNPILEEPRHVFVSHANSLVLTFRWSKVDAIDGPPKGSFTLKFFAFYDEPCNEEGSAVDPCASYRCMYSDFRCHDALNACGNDSAETCGDEPDNVLEVISRFLDDNGVKITYILIPIILLIALKCVYTALKANYGSVKKFPFIRNLFSSDTHSEHSNSSRRNSQAQRDEFLAMSTITHDASSEEDDGVNRHTDFNTVKDTNPTNNGSTSATRYPSTQETSVPLDSEPFQPPPPSYDAVVNDEQLYKPAE